MQAIQHCLENYIPTRAIEISLWKTTKKFKNRFIEGISPIKKTDCSWARDNKEKAKTFPQHFTIAFIPKF